MSKKKEKKNDNFPNKCQKLTNYFLSVKPNREPNERIDKEESTSQKVVGRNIKCCDLNMYFIEEKTNPDTNKSTAVNSDFSRSEIYSSNTCITEERNNYDKNKSE